VSVGAANVPGARPDVAWTFDPWSERPWAASVAALAVLAMWLAVALSGLPGVVALLLGGFAAVPLLPAFVPASCRVDERGAECRGLVTTARRAWSEVRRIEDVPVGVLLSPFTARSWLDATRSLTLPMPRARRDELRAVVRAMGARA